MQDKALDKDDSDITSFDLLRGLFAFETEHWLTVNIGVPIRIKYTPLSIREKININNKYSHINNDGEKNMKVIREQCLAMLTKAGYKNIEDIDSLPNSTIYSIYTEILTHMSEFKHNIEKYCEEYQTKPLKPSKKKPHELDSLVNIVIICKEAHLSLQEISDYDELTLFCLLMGLGEIGTRESNEYEKSKE